IEQELFMVAGAPLVTLAWRIRSTGQTPRDARLHVRPLFSGRDYHALHHENSAFAFAPEESPSGWTWRPYPGVPGVIIRANARYCHDPTWYRNFCYSEERSRGLDFIEDLAAPGVFTFDLADRAAVMLLGADQAETSLGDADRPPEVMYEALRSAEEHRRARFASP